MQQDPLTQTLYQNYVRSGREVGYWGSYFLRALKKHGGLKLAQHMLAKSTKTGITKGFLALADAGRPDLSVEAVVLSPQFRKHFTKRELAIAEQRLKRFPEAAWRKSVSTNSIYPVRDYLVYHNPDIMRVLSASAPQFAVVTNKKVGDVKGSRVWLLTGKGSPRTFFLHSYFIVDQVGSGAREGFKTKVLGTVGKVFSPMIELNEQDWFLQLRPPGTRKLWFRISTY